MDFKLPFFFEPIRVRSTVISLLLAVVRLLQNRVNRDLINCCADVNLG